MFWNVFRRPHRAANRPATRRAVPKMERLEDRNLLTGEPLLTLPAGPAVYQVSDPAVVLDTAATVTDPDSPDFDTGVLTVEFVANGTADDRLAIRNQGTAAGQIGVAGSDVTFGGTVIGSFAGGQGTTALAVTLDPDATPTAVQALLRNVTYRNVSTTPSLLDRTVRFTLTDGDGNTSNQPPKIVAYNLDEQFDPNVQGSNLSSGFGSINTNQERAQTFTVGTSGILSRVDVFIRRFSGTTGDLILEIRETGADGRPVSGTGQHLLQTSVAALDVFTFPNPVAFFSFDLSAFDLSVSAGQQLAITLHAGAGNVTYQWIGTNTNPYAGGTALERVIGNHDWIVENATWDLGFRTYASADVAEPPVVTLPGGAVSYTEGDPPVVLDATATVTDPDSADFDTGTLTVALTANGTADDRLEIRNQGSAAGQIGVTAGTVTFGGTAVGTFTGGQGTTPLVVTLNANATPAAVEALVRNLTFHNVSVAPSATTRTLTVTLADGDGGISDPATTEVNVTSVNTAPTINVTEARVEYTPGAAPAVIDATAAVTDLDSANFDGGVLTVEITANAEATDVLTVVAGGEVTVNGNEVSVNGTVVGTLAGGTGTTALEVTFNTNAGLTAVRTVLRNVAYGSTAQSPSASLRTLQLTLSDGDGGTSNVDTATVNPSSLRSLDIDDGTSGTAGDVIGGQHSAVRRITLLFKQPVDFAPGLTPLLSNRSVATGGQFEIQLLRSDGKTFRVNAEHTLVDGNSLLTLRFSGGRRKSLVRGGSLADGIYTLQIVSGVASIPAPVVFQRRFGDTDGDGDVDAVDNQVFQQAVGYRLGESGYVSFLDFNNDGKINRTDKLAFRKRLTL